MKQTYSRMTCLLLACALLGGCAAAPVSAPRPAPAQAEPPAPAQAEPPAPAPEAVPEADASALWPDPGIAGNLSADPSPKDDLAAYLNYDWYKNTEIPEGYSAWSSFSELEEKVKARMLDTLRAPDESAEQQKAAALFRAVKDTDARDAAGLGVLKDTFAVILAASTLEELNKLLSEDPDLFYFTPLAVAGVSPDSKNSAMNAALLYAPMLSLSDSAEYKQLSDQGARRKAANETYHKALLTHNGVSEADAERMIADLYAWETKLAAGVYPVETSYRDDYLTLTYNEYSREALAELTANVPLLSMLDNVGFAKVSRFIVSEPEAFKTLNAIFTEEELPGIKAYLAINLLTATASYCDSFSEDASIEWSNALYGSSGRKAEDVRALTLCDSLIGELLGKVYAAKYADEAVKTDVTNMVREMFAAYKQRLAAADWLGEATRKTAIEKLDAMTLRVSYPEIYRIDWDKIDITDAPLIENVRSIVAEQTRQNNARVDTPVNKELWSMTAHTVNAYYEPSDNSINFPAAILNAPFYDAQRSRSQNLGGIGSVIAHEITHAFDTTGSQFDKQGNMVNWWTDEDRAAFKLRTDRVAARYASIEVLPGEYVRGDLTIGETVADLGALACTLDIMRTLEDADYEGYIKAWVGVWAQRITPETRSYYLKYDPHAPSYLRANVTLQQFQELYDTYDIKEGDFMYTAPEDRLTVW